MRLHRIGAALTATATLLLLACATPAAAPQPTATPVPTSSTSIKIGYPSLGGNLMALWTAQEAGIFAKNGLSSEALYIAGSPNTIKALLAGDVQYAVVGASASVRAALGGSDVVLIATAAPGLAFRIYGRPEIRSLQDLRGKRLVQSVAGTDPDVAIALALQHENIPFDEVQYVRLDTGGDPARLAALQASGAEAVIVSPGIFGKAEKEFGLHVVSDIISQQIPYEQATVAAKRAYVTAHPDEVQRFVRAFTESLRYVRDHRDATLAATRKFSGVDDQSVLDETYDYYVGSVFPRAPYVSEQGIQTLLDLVAREDPRASQHRAAEYIDSRFVKTLEDEGFLKQLYPN
jgi:NitT/TauT family transport system substrate-binding protein